MLAVKVIGAFWQIRLLDGETLIVGTTERVTVTESVDVGEVAQGE
jgi:hypothetical protein